MNGMRADGSAWFRVHHVLYQAPWLITVVKAKGVSVFQSARVQGPEKGAGTLQRGLEALQETQLLEASAQHLPLSSGGDLDRGRGERRRAIVEAAKTRPRKRMSNGS